MPRLRKPAPKTLRNRVVAAPYARKAKAVPAQRLTKVTLPALRCLAQIDFGDKGWRPEGAEE